MKIGVIADSHLNQGTPELQGLLSGLFADVEIILHAGDITEMAVLESFYPRKVLAVSGNMDSPAVRRQLPTHRIFRHGKFTIGLIHGWGSRTGIEERIRRVFADVDCIVYGHTHAPAQSRREGVLFFNPGAFAGGMKSPRGSVGLLDLQDTLCGRIACIE